MLYHLSYRKLIIHNNASSSEKSPSPVVSHIKIQPQYLFRAVLDCFWLVNAAWSVQISLLIQTRTLYTGGSVIVDYGLIFQQQFEVKNTLMMDLFAAFVFSRYNWWTGVVWITCGLLWCFYQLFGLSFWRHPFTAEDPLVSKFMKTYI